MKNKNLKPGFYYYVNENIDTERCFYITGTLKGNKWIEIRVLDPEWTSLFWNCISESELNECTYFQENPTKYPINE
jgi:hypothetical protein